MTSEFITYYTDINNYFRCYYHQSDKFETLKKVPINYSSFYLTKNYKSTDDDLKRYANDIVTSNNQLKQYIKTKYKKSFDYIEPYISDGKMYNRNHFKNIERFFKMFLDYDVLEQVEEESIDLIESGYIEKCYNAGLIYNIKGECQSYGYDYSNFYASNLSSDKFMIPIKKGKEMTFKKLPCQIRFGFWKVKITCNDPEFRKVFAFSKHNVYTSYSLIFAMKYQERFNVNIELLQDGKPNSYIYDKKRITGDKVFKTWYEAIIDIKKNCPGNILIKMLSSSLWGHLCRSNIKYVSEDQLAELNVGTSTEADYIIDSFGTNTDGSLFFKLINQKQPYKYNWSRLKPFITSFSRNRTAETAMMQLEDVIRIHTDNVCYSKPFNHKIDGFIPEAKTTGLLTFPINRSRTDEE